jgi:putative transposase
MVAAPSDYRWSSYAVNAEGKPDGWLHAHPSYEALSDQPPLRHSAYRALCESAPPQKVIEEILKARRRGAGRDGAASPRTTGEG